MRSGTERSQNPGVAISTLTNTAAARAATQPNAIKRSPTWRFGLTTGVVAAAIVTIVVVALRAAGVPFDVDGEPVPVLAFAQMVLLGTVIGIVLARRVPTTTFVRATVALTAVSCIPSLAIGTGVASKIALVTTHVLAAAIIVPRLARHQ